jgi:micrococcal nuclease
MPSRHKLLPILLASALLVAALAQLRGHGDDRTIAGTVVRVVDGDTIRVRIGSRVERVRYIGIDTPESVKPGTPVQCFAEAAHALNARLVAGRRVRLVSDAEARDRYGRLLAYVYREGDGLFVNAELVRRGYAQTLTIPPNVRHAARLAALAQRARAAGAGLWSAC